MKKKRAVFLPLCMLLLVLAGALMPRAVAALQDRQLASQTEARTLDDIQLTLRQGAGVAQTLSILSSGYTQIQLQEGSALTQAVAETAAKEALDLLVREGLLPDLSWQHTAAPTVFAAISQRDAADSAVIWSYTFVDQSQTRCTVWLDEASRKMVSISLVADGLTSTYYTESTVATVSDGQPTRWAAFLQTYYGLESAVVADGYRDNSGSVFTLSLTWLSEKTAVSCSLPMMFRGDDLFFCW